MKVTSGWTETLAIRGPGDTSCHKVLSQIVRAAHNRGAVLDDTSLKSPIQQIQKNSLRKRE